MEEKRRALLRKLRVTRVDLVPVGANQESHVLLAKAAKPPSRDSFGRFGQGAGKPKPGAGDAGDSVDATEPWDTDLGSVKAYLISDGDDKTSPAAVLAELKKPGSSGIAAVQAAAKKFRSSRKPMTARKPGGRPPKSMSGGKPAARPPKSMTGSAGSAAGAREYTTKENTMSLAEEIAQLSDDEQEGVVQYVTGLASELEDQRAKAAEAVEALAKAQAESEEEDPDAVLKGLPEAVVARIVKAESDAASAKAEAEAVTKAERHRVFKARAAQLVQLSGGEGEGVDRLGDILNKAEAALSEDDYAELERTLVAADTQIAKSEVLTKELGGVGETVDPDLDTVRKRAVEIAKAEEIPEADALRKAIRENADEARKTMDAVARGERP
jgi:hypothetical protein